MAEKRSGGTPGSAENRDPNDEKVMANSPGDKEGREVQASLSTLNSSEASPIAAYYEFPSSKVEKWETYSNRLSALEEKLGNKDSAKG